MALLKRLYFDAYLVIYALYAYFNKGIAYSYLSEALLILGLLLILSQLRSYAFAWDRRMAILLLFLVLTAGYMVRGVMQQYSLKDVIRDSVMFNYILFAFIIYFFKDELPRFCKGLFTIYKWYPLVICICFLLSSYVPSFRELKLFGDFSIFHYKFGDMGVHLLVATLFLLNGYIRLPRRFLIANYLLIAYAFLIASSYSRSGMVSFVAGVGIFFLFTANMELKQRMKYYLKLSPVIILLALPLYLSTNLEENFQGRKLGIGQLKENVTSIFSSNSDNGSLSDNKVWRLVWWAKIIDYTFLGEYFLQGKGLGMSLAMDDDIAGTDDSLRSPHSFHLTVLARFGVPLFFIWLYWVYLHGIRIRRKQQSPFLLVLMSCFVAFIVNASFDVYLEGPMGAFPFWTIVGLTYACEAFGIKLADDTDGIQAQTSNT